MDLAIIHAQKFDKKFEELNAGENPCWIKKKKRKERKKERK